MSEKREKFKRRYLRFMKSQGVFPEPKRKALTGHSNALCATGRHDFVGPFTRDSKKRHVKIWDRWGFLTIGRKTVWEKAPRGRVCRQCGQTHVQSTTGHWLNFGKANLQKLGL